MGHAGAERAKKLTNDRSFVNPNARKIPYNTDMLTRLFTHPSCLLAPSRRDSAASTT
jgi:hypothetical protein